MRETVYDIYTRIHAKTAEKERGREREGEREENKKNLLVQPELMPDLSRYGTKT